ncbi:hypothetical protein N7517_001190 [Penicillium concentricum]|uniref:DNA2/NAM7 helicase-like C-terminal domain-containing protein n=1 Tax=Penicillium concentricum TaxID=293559 RepID=A0A9W9ST04_9EURO|nr:uncharacterized protein N7517_001190 [Penicillium concentricum]KAJ5383279.1 hypothetical protein N7517_001190 [Penicillium concentricum]
MKKTGLSLSPRICRYSTSILNYAHVVTGRNLVRRLLAENIVEPGKIAIIAGYEAQYTVYVAVAARCIEHDASGSEDWLNISIHKIDSFQGMEASIAIIDVVRTNELGFMREFR